MNLPDVANPVWAELASGRKEIPLEFLAAKMLVVRLRLSLRSDPSPFNLAKCALELHHLYAQNLTLASAQRDIAKMDLKR